MSQELTSRKGLPTVSILEPLKDYGKIKVFGEPLQDFVFDSKDARSMLPHFTEAPVLIKVYAYSVSNQTTWLPEPVIVLLEGQGVPAKVHGLDKDCLMWSLSQDLATLSLTPHIGPLYNLLESQHQRSVFMTSALSDHIVIVNPGGVPHTAWLAQTDVHNVGAPFPSTDDPEWHYRNMQNGQEGRNEWIYYVTYNGDISHTKVHCQYNVAPPGPSAGPYIACWFEHRNAQGEEDQNAANRNKMLYRGPDGRNWQAIIQNVTRPFPAQPKFQVSPM